MKSQKIKLWLAVSVLILAMLACTLPDLESLTMTVKETEVVQVPSTVSYVIPEEVLLEDALISLYQEVSPGVVSIQVYSEYGAGIGSGFVHQLPCC